MAHTAARRRGYAGDKSDDRLFDLMLRQKLGSVDLGRSADFTDHDDRLGLGVMQQHVEHFDKIESLHSSASDAWTAALAKPGRAGLRDRLIGQRAGTPSLSTGPRFTTIRWRTSRLAFIRCNHARTV